MKIAVLIDLDAVSAPEVRRALVEGIQRVELLTANGFFWRFEPNQFTSIDLDDVTETLANAVADEIGRRLVPLLGLHR